MTQEEYENLKETLFKAFEAQAKGAVKSPTMYSGAGPAAQACAEIATAIVNLERGASEGLVEGMRFNRIK